MTDEATETTRVVVLLEDSRGARAALDTAAALAARLDSELLGVFVEDTDILRTAGLPFSCEISVTSGQVRPLQSEQLERQLRERAHSLERALARASQRHALQSRFQVSRDRVERAALAMTQPRDTLVVGRNGWRRSYVPTIGGIASRLARGTRCGLFIVGEEPPRSDRPLMVLQPAGDDPTRTLDTAIHLAQDRSQPLCILLPRAAGRPSSWNAPRVPGRSVSVSRCAFSASPTRPRPPWWKRCAAATARPW
ncbi:MAG: hypothetical protein U5L11_05775 [Arhodomonas sp.]|nr:hypothetical protein [Arhodomonas sp.]